MMRHAPIRGVTRATMALTLGTLALGFACGTKTDLSISASDYDQACSADTDCVAVYDGAVGCCGAGCPNAAIALTSANAYRHDLSLRTPTCNPAPPCAALSPATCRTPGAVCLAGKCALNQHD